ncbi:hypothetical protein VSS74_29390 [Conexibacter stalactiti]|uniref:Uncharacterized protein n=1 Tax=Conexibacter stalactiti TaxID=1940611 RepID=A0ABU4HZ14_9ACTN|nr:hypothetical protein [Conexibacter stalactiti]MDW5598511.1 hypothetical protein [Conexibacter stalactiti]MEC5039153.1 hypothetical protein [Conexibacter stalactiti]
MTLRPSLAAATALLASAALLAPAAADAAPKRRSLRFAVTLELTRTFATTLTPAAPLAGCSDAFDPPVEGTTQQRETIRPLRRTVLAYVYTDLRYGAPIVSGPSLQAGRGESVPIVATVQRSADVREEPPCDFGIPDDAPPRPAQIACLGTTTTEITDNALTLGVTLRGFVLRLPYTGGCADREDLFPTLASDPEFRLDFATLRAAKRPVVRRLSSQRDCSLRETAYAARCRATVAGTLTLTRLRG